jgi:hypothetical protein
VPELEQKRILREASRRNIEGVRSFIKFSIEALDVARLRASGILPTKPGAAQAGRPA